ncbi:MAG: hypothetical protein P4M07_19190 [Xanthobacteraceae bacterium]|nr:hypothetical protein [Xanthobacteraceae bacterium]
MFTRRATFGAFQSLSVVRGQPAPFHRNHLNDNRAGLRRPADAGRRSRLALACHWAADEAGALECRWDVVADDDLPLVDPDRPRLTGRAFEPPLRPRRAGAEKRAA